VAHWEGYRFHQDVACQGCHFAGYELSTECSSCHDLDGTDAVEPVPTAEPSPTPEPTPEPEPGADEVGLLSEQIAARFAEWKPVATAEALFENLNDGDEANGRQA
jgi:hypothetical protein